MKSVNQQIVKQITDISERLQISKAVAARSLRDNFLEEGLKSSAAEVNKYLICIKETA